MKKIACVLSLLLATGASASRLDAPAKRTPSPIKSPRQAEVMREARAMYTLADGSLWVTHPVPAESEPSALGVTRFGTDGSAKVFLVSDWLPKGSIPNGWCGQVYSVTTLTDGRVAASAGWTDGRDSHNAIFILSRRADGTYKTDKMFEWPAVAEIIGGPKNTILAATNHPFQRNGGPTVTMFNTSGAVIGSMQGNKPPMTALEASQHARNVRLRRVSENRFATYEPSTGTVWVNEVEVKRSDTVWTGIIGIFVDDDPHTAHLRVIGFEVSPDGKEILVARTGQLDGNYRTQLTLYSSRGVGEVKQKSVTDMPWNFMIRRNNEIHGLVRDRDVLLDTVRFVAD